MAGYLDAFPGRVLLVIFVAGLTLRSLGVSSASMTHYDEYYYAQSGLWVVIGDEVVRMLRDGAADNELVKGSPPARLRMLHPMLPLHAPLLYPTLIGLVYLLVGGPWYSAGALVSALFGAASILAVYAIGRRTADVRVALASAALLAVCDFHVAYSRTWLVDSTFGFLFTLAMYCVLRLFQTGAVRWSLAAGAATGLAWNTKYNGWMPLAVALAAWAAIAVRGSWRGMGVDGKGTLRRLVLLLAALLISAVMFSPWYVFVERHFPGGFHRVVEHHRLFTDASKAWRGAPSDLQRPVEAAKQWWSNARRLADELPAYRHWGWRLVLLALSIALAMKLWREVQRRGALGCGARLLAAAPELCLLAGSLLCIVGCGLSSFLLLAGAGVGLNVLGRRRPRPEDCLAAVWLGAFLILVPYYRAYSRLLIPAMPAAIVLVASCWPAAREGGWRAGAAEAGETADRSSRWRPLARRLALTGAGAALAALALLTGRWSWLELRGVASCWPAKDSYRALAQLVMEKTPRDAIVICHTQPTLWFALEREYKDPLDTPLEQIPFANRPYYVAADWLIHTRPLAQSSMLASAGRLRRVASVPNNMPPPAMFNFPVISGRDFWRKMRALGRNEPQPRSDFLPPPINQPTRDCITLYQVLDH